MFKIFIYDIFETNKYERIFLKLFLCIFEVFIFSIIAFLINNFFLDDISFEKYNLLFFLISFVCSLFIDYKPHKITRDIAIRKGKFYKFLVLVFNLILSWPCILYLSSLIILRVSILTCFIYYSLLVFSVIFTFCLNRNTIIKFIVLILTCEIVFTNNFAFAIMSMFLLLGLYCIFQNKCFDEYEVSQIKSNIIEISYKKNTITNAMLVDWIFIIRNKKGLLFTALFVSFGILTCFYFWKIYNPSLLTNFQNINFLLLVSLTSGCFACLIGPLTMNWFYYYSEDFLSKNWSVEQIIKGKIALLRLCTLIIFILTLPILFIINIDFSLIIYFFIMNSSVSIMAALFAGITEITKIVGNKSPRLNVEKGSPISGLVPWMCELISVLIFIVLYKIIPVFWIFIISIFIFGIINSVNDTLINKFVILINNKISNRSDK